MMPSVNLKPAIPIIGILGGIGAGKSSIVRHVTGVRLKIVDADRIGHELLQNADVRDMIVKTLGATILAEDQTIDRRRVADLVFGPSKDHEQRRLALNQIVHPRIREEVQRSVAEVSSDVDAIILDAALLLETGWADLCDVLIFIDTPLELRRKRVHDTRHWTAEEHARRESAQRSVEEKRSRSQFVVDNSGTPESAARQIEHIIQHLIQEKTVRR